VGRKCASHACLQAHGKLSWRHGSDPRHATSLERLPRVLRYAIARRTQQLPADLEEVELGLLRRRQLRAHVDVEPGELQRRRRLKELGRGWHHAQWQQRQRLRD
jgi:hypothetical protein